MTRSVLKPTIAPGKRSSRTRRLLPVGGLAAAALLLGACSGGPGSEEDFVEILERGDSFDSQQATCIASAVFAEYGSNDGAIDALSGANDWSVITETEGLEGFEDFYSGVVSNCTSVGPSADG